MTHQSTEGAAHKVVIYRSAITDIRTVEARLRRAGLTYEVEVMSMAGQDERKRYRELKQSSGYSTLPLIFIDGACVGGEPELARHLAAQRDDSTDSAPVAEQPDDAEADEAPAPEEDLTGAAPAPEAQAVEAMAPPTLEPLANTNGGDLSALRRRTALLGYAGLLPFLACAIGSVVGPLTSLAQLGLVAYGAVIFSFVGAVHWGYSLAHEPTQARGLLASVVPSLLGWGALLLHSLVGAVAGLLLLAASFGFWHLFERLDGRLPAHYLSLRLRLTSIVVVLLVAAAAAQLTGLAPT